MYLRLRRNYPILLLLAFVLGFLVLVMGDRRVVAYSARPEATPTATVVVARDVTNSVALFDEGVVHSIQVIMSNEDYTKMVSSYKNAGLKDYFRADILMDGVRIADVGIRLKGNASLRTALGGGMRMGGGNRPNAMPPGGQPPAMDGNARGGAPGGPGGPGGPPPAGAPGDGAGMPPGGPGGGVSAGQIKVPFLIRFDKYVPGQTYQGYSKIAIRNYGTSYDAAMLQEPLTNTTVRQAGLPATRTAYAGFKLNDAAETLYVVTEILDERYLAEYFDNGGGILYKAEVGSTLSYVGEDPSSYSRSFSQETRVNDADLAPLIDFMRFLDQADDATFERELPRWLDVDSFAAYLALNNLLVNTDSMLGMNNNYYLYYDDVQQRFTLLMWDANESLGKLGGSANYDLYFKNTGGAPGGRGGMGGGPGRGQNVLMTRFMANATFKALYEQKVKAIYHQAFAAGTLQAGVERYAALIHSANEGRSLVEITAYDQAVQKMKNFIDQRNQYLSSTSLLSQ